MKTTAHYSILSAVFCFLACTSIRSSEKEEQVVPDSYHWTRLTSEAAFRKSYNFQAFARLDTLYVFHPDGVYASANGKEWKQHSPADVIGNQAFLDYVRFNGQVLGLGWLEGNIETYQFKPFIFASTDFKNWDTLSATSNLPERFFYHPFSFDSLIWIIGGEDINGSYADVWNSPDGIHWTKQKDHLPFGPRSNSQVVELNGKLYLLNNDVWSSENGLDWEQVTPEILAGQTLFGYQAMVFDNHIWLLGCSRNGAFDSKVFASADGKTWTVHEAPWSARGGMAAAVMNNKLYVTGGKYGGFTRGSTVTEFEYSNDVWVMEKW